MSSIDDGGPAFPESGPRGRAVGGEGMSLRDYFAIRVAAAMLTATSADRDFPNLSYRREEDGPTLAERVAAIAYTMAGAMLKARGVRDGR